MTGRLLVLGPKPIAATVRSRLTAAYGGVEARPLHSPSSCATDPYGIAEVVRTEGEGVDGVLVIVPEPVAMDRVVGGPVVHGTPVGVVPADKAEHLEPWLQAVDWYARNPGGGTAVLSMWKPLYLRWAERLAEALSGSAAGQRSGVERWFADEVSQEDLCRRLATGPRLVFYVGHGRCTGWSGYRGLRWRHVDAVPSRRPSGTLVSLTCHNLGRPRDGGLPFGVRWVRSGRACAFLGAVGSLDLRALEEISDYLMTALSAGARTLGELATSVDAQVTRFGGTNVCDAWSRVRIVGSPLQLL